jgi:pimeloyl-ACP methyl ester carboxylesterase
MRYTYLHGFASGPHSRKAQAFQRSFERLGIDLSIPALDQGDFAHLTISRQLNLINQLLAGEPARLIGSSMGGYLAALYASTHPEVDRLVQLAPAFDFSSRWEVLTGPEKLAAWHDTGWLEVFHYGKQTTERVHFDLFEDARKHAPNPDFRQPARIFHGTRDEVVPIGLSRAFAASHPNAELTELDSDHELLDVLDTIVAAAVPFLVA